MPKYERALGTCILNVVVVSLVKLNKWNFRPRILRKKYLDLQSPVGLIFLSLPDDFYGPWLMGVFRAHGPNIGLDFGLKKHLARVRVSGKRINICMYIRVCTDYEDGLSSQGFAFSPSVLTYTRKRELEAQQCQASWTDFSRRSGVADSSSRESLSDG